MEHIKMGHMARIGKKALSAFDLSHIISKLEFVSPVLRIVKGRVVCQMRPDKAKKAVLRVLCDCYPNVWPSVPEIARRCGYSVRHVGRTLRELETKDKLIVDVNSRLIWKNGKLAGSDDEGKKGGSPKDTPQYFICDRRIYDIFQQQQEFKRLDKADKRRPKPLTSHDKSEANSSSEPLTSQNPTPDISAPDPRHLNSQPLTYQNPTPDTKSDEPIMSCNQSLGTSQVGTSHVNQARIQHTDAQSNGKPQTPSTPFSLHDMTVTEETVGSRFQGSEQQSVDAVVHLISDGEFKIAALNSYDELDELRDSCLEAVRRMEREPFAGRATCAEIMSRAMDILWLRSIKAPNGWLPVLKKLREGGPATAPKPVVQIAKPSIAPAEILTNSWSALGQCRDRLQPYNDRLVEIASYKGVPGSWRDAVHILDCAIDGDIPHEEAAPLIVVRDEIRARIPAA